MNVLIGLGITYLVTFLIEALTEYLLGQPFDKIPKIQPYKWLLTYAAAAAGVGLSIYYKLDVVALMGGYLSEALKVAAPVQTDYTVVGAVLTGLLAGRGSNYLHQFISKFFPSK